MHWYEELWYWKEGSKYSTQDTYPKSIILPLAFHQCPSLLYGTCLFHNNHEQWIWPQERKMGRSKGNLYCFRIMELLLSCRVSRAQDNAVMPSYNLYIVHGVGEMGLTTQTRACQLGSSHQGHPQGPHCSRFPVCYLSWGQPRRVEAGSQKLAKSWPSQIDDTDV